MISFFNIKGGVGKSTLSINIAHSLSLKYKVLIWDIDPQGAISYFFNKRAKNRYINFLNVEYKIKKTKYKNLSLLPADLTLRTENIDKIFKRLNSFDIIIIDHPAGNSDINSEFLKHSNLIVIPIFPNALSILTYNKIIKLYPNLNIKLVVNSFEKKLHHLEIISKIKQLPKNQFFSSIIPRSSFFEKTFFDKKTIYEKPLNSIEFRAITKLSNEIENYICK